MFLLAACILLGTVRLAKRETIESGKVNKEKIRTFSKAFDSEVKRLDELYLIHLDRVAKNYATDDPLASTKALQIEGIIKIYDLLENKHPKVIDTFKLADESDIPKVLITEAIPEVIENAILLHSNLLESHYDNQSGWRGITKIEDYDSKYLLRWVRQKDRQLIAILIDRQVVVNLINSTLIEWLKPLADELVADGISFEVAHSSSDKLFENDKKEGEADIVMPIYSSMDEWVINTWRPTNTIIYYDIFTLEVGVLIAGILIVSGIVFYYQQSRALMLAQQQVSFINQVSHELGSPLTNISLNLELVHEQISSDNTKAQYRIGLITQEIERLNRLVENVLTFSRHERESIVLTPKISNLNELIATLLESYQPALERRDIKIEWIKENLPEINTDPDAVLQIIVNLISNVEKYASSGKSLLIKTEVKNESVLISVIDKGPGIPKQSINRIFRSFERVQSRVDEGSSGAGLGLTISRSLAMKLGGNLELIRYTNGCHFELSLPIKNQIKE